MQYSAALAAAFFALTALTARPAATQSTDGASRIGFSATGSVAGAPIGQIAERNGLYAVPGLEYDLRAIVTTSSEREWSLGLLRDEYRTDTAIGLTSSSSFEYVSTAVVVGLGSLELEGPVPVRYGIDLGWRHFEALSDGPNYYTGQQETSSVVGNAALLATSFGIEIPLDGLVLVPRARLETNYPDFGGGDGYSALHREMDLGFRASLGIGVKKLF